MSKEVGYIYKITCTVENKSYVGQTTKVASNTMKDPVQFRLLCHFSNSKKKSKHGHGCRLLYEAMRRHNRNKFIIKQLIVVPFDQLDDYEQKYIKSENTLAPNGYNLTTGGAAGSEFCQESKDLISESQYGNRRAPKERKHADDANLPKNITSCREKGKHIGYNVQGFPIGKRQYINKKFSSTILTLDENLLVAKQCLLDIKEKHKAALDKIKKKREGKDDYEEDIKITYPSTLIQVKQKGKLIGFKVKGDQTKFTGSEYLYEDLREALLHTYKLALKKKDNKFVPDVDDLDDEDMGVERKDGVALPKYMSLEKRNGEVIGYFVNNYPVRDEDGTIIKKAKKKFCNTKEPMKDKYEKCLNHLNGLKDGSIKP